MSISLVMTVKNEGTNLPDLIKDIEAQTQKPDQWIVVDGGSSDDTIKLFEEVRDCRLIEHPGNIARGRNRGVELATGELIVTTDAGCRLPPNWLEELVAPFASSSSASSISNVAEHREANRSEFDAEPTVDIVGGTTHARIRNSFDAVQWALLDQLNFRAHRHREPRFSCRSLAFRRDVWSACSFPEWLDHGEDAWAQLQWQRLGFKAVAVDAPAVTWEMRESMGQFFLQHYRYAIADGVAGMRRRTHFARVGFYFTALLLILLGFGSASPWLIFASAGLWGGYFVLNALRLLQVLKREHQLGWIPLAVALLLPMLGGLDLAKMSGFLVGRTRRGEPVDVLDARVDRG